MPRRMSERSNDVTVYMVLNDYRTGLAYVERPRTRLITKPSFGTFSVGNTRMRAQTWAHSPCCEDRAAASRSRRRAAFHRAFAATLACCCRTSGVVRAILAVWD
jgi:hypothetical protein